MLNGLCKNQHLDEALKFSESIDAGRQHGGIKVFNILIDGMCRAGRMSEAMKLFGSISVKDDLLPDAIIIRGLVNNNLFNDAYEGFLDIEEKRLYSKCFPL
ncbi:hypothetical protein Taro_030962 [Colocasia esculenta]|uniref:Pentatricopeptide repeat-containing protein n=1 Tax=Colocasia esculenta TaxID=4460 RepID=A0A843VMQ2_COLES|nr:hypothetical protein [Colocasia esculenta]